MGEEEYYNRIIDDLLHSEAKGKYIMNKVAYVKTASEYVETVFYIFKELPKSFNKFSGIIAKYPIDNLDVILANLKLKSYDAFLNEFMTDFSSIIYQFTTENIAGYIEEFDLKDKSLMTVGSSGDQLINAILYDCKDITHFDCNIYCKYYIYLKLACIMELSKEEFLNFLVSIDGSSNYNPLAFNINTFMKISDTLKNLNNDSFYFWQQLLNYFDGKKLSQVLFKCSKKDNLKYVNPYLADDDAYTNTRAKIMDAHISFINGNVLNANLTQKFDNIWLSNICGYLGRDENDKVIRRFLKNLNSNGKMLMTYIYDVYESYVPFNNRSDYGKILKIKHKVKEFNGIKDIGLYSTSVDSALIYHKK